MRKALIIILSLLFMFGVAAATFSAYNNHQQELSMDEIVAKDKIITRDGIFKGKFLCELDGKRISKYEYKIEDSTLYITFYATAGEKGFMPADEEGYVEISIDVGTNVDKVYYLADGEDSVMSYNKED